MFWKMCRIFVLHSSYYYCCYNKSISLWLLLVVYTCFSSISQNTCNSKTLWELVYASCYRKLYRTRLEHAEHRRVSSCVYIEGWIFYCWYELLCATCQWQSKRNPAQKRSRQDACVFHGTKHQVLSLQSLLLVLPSVMPCFFMLL